MDRDHLSRWLRRAVNGLGLWAVLVQHGLLPPAIAVVGVILGVIGLLIGTISGNLMVAALVIAAASISIAVALAVVVVRVTTHDDQERQTTAQSFRAALFEVTEACRFWVSRDPSRGAPSAARLRGWASPFERTRQLVATVDLPAELVAYLAWIVGEIEEENRRLQALLDWDTANANSALASPPDATTLRDAWWVIIDRLQTLACLVGAEAERGGLAAVAAAYRGNPYLAPLAGAPDERVHLEANDVALCAAPRFPSDPAYAGCAAPARDRAGAERSAASQAELRRRFRR